LFNKFSELGYFILFYCLEHKQIACKILAL
jgi:hypothetical protein